MLGELLRFQVAPEEADPFQASVAQGFLPRSFDHILVSRDLVNIAKPSKIHASIHISSLQACADGANE